MAEAQALAQQAERAMEAALANHAKRIGVQDGTSRTALREWLEEVSSAKDWTRCNDAQIMKMVGYLVKGDLDTSIRGFIRNQGAVTGFS